MVPQRIAQTMNQKKHTIVYFDAMEDPACGEVFYNGILSGLEKSERARQELEVIPIRFNYGERRFSPRLMEELARECNAQGVILSGSEKNTSERQNAWVQDYLFGLGRLVESFPQMPVFGICFGHQALACLFGGETARFKYKSGFVSIKTSHQAPYHPIMKKFSPEYKMGVTHGDHVIRIPQGFHLLATSDYCDCQAMAHDTRPIFSVQAHPELTDEILKVSSEKEDWEKYSAEEFQTQDGPKFLAHVFEWMCSQIKV
jgi:GMP synthase-like glutamine amidotransferase